MRAGAAKRSEYGHLIAEADGNTGATLREYLWLPSNGTSNDTMAEEMGLAANDNAPVDMPLAVIDGTTLYHIHTDHLGRPIRMTDAVKATVWQASYKPWGEVQSITGTVANNLRHRRFARAQRVRRSKHATGMF
jgi:uncharacterized protein RhaS with RHS repeats